MEVIKSNKVGVYRTVYRQPSEFFIKEQLSGFSRYSPIVLARELTDLAMSDGIDSVKLGGGWWRKFIFTMFGCLSKKTLDKINNLKLIHAHFGPDAAVIMKVAERLNVPFVFTCHGFDVQQSKLKQLLSFKLTNILFLLRERRLYLTAARVIVVSEYLKSRLVERGCPAEKITVHYIGTCCDKKSGGSEGEREKRTIINIARHVNWKGVDVLIKAIALVKKQIPNIMLLQIGSGSETDFLKKMAYDFGVADNIKWLGEQNHDQVLCFLNSADLYVHPSRVDSAGQTEAFGISLIEAQALGLPVVASRNGGIPEAVANNQTGFLFEEGDFGKMAEMIVELLSNTKLYDQFSNSAQEYTRQNFNVSKQSILLEEIYDQVSIKHFDKI